MTKATANIISNSNNCEETKLYTTCKEPYVKKSQFTRSYTSIIS